MSCCQLLLPKDSGRYPTRSNQSSQFSNLERKSSARTDGLANVSWQQILGCAASHGITKHTLATMSGFAQQDPTTQSQPGLADLASFERYCPPHAAPGCPRPGTETPELRPDRRKGTAAIFHRLLSEPPAATQASANPTDVHCTQHGLCTYRGLHPRISRPGPRHQSARQERW